MKPMQTQIPLLELDEELVMRKARQLFEESALLTRRWSSFEQLMADPTVGRCLRMSARVLLARRANRANRTRGRRR